MRIVHEPVMVEAIEVTTGVGFIDPASVRPRFGQAAAETVDDSKTTGLRTRALESG